MEYERLGKISDWITQGINTSCKYK